MNDIFKYMQAKVGCEYLSDLPSYKPVSYTHLDVYKRQVYSLKIEAGKTATLKVSDTPKVTDTLRCV